MRFAEDYLIKRLAQRYENDEAAALPILATMKPSYESARDFNHTLVELADRLATHNIVVGSLQCRWSKFGSWVLTAMNGRAAEELTANLLRGNYSARGPEVVSVTWDDCGFILRIEATPRGVLAMWNKWEKEVEHKFGTGDEAMRFAEDYLIKRLA